MAHWLLFAIGLDAIIKNEVHPVPTELKPSSYALGQGFDKFSSLSSFIQISLKCS